MSTFFTRQVAAPKTVWTALSVLLIALAILAISGTTRPTIQAAEAISPDSNGDYHLMVTLKMSRTYRSEGDMSPAATDRQRNDITEKRESLIASLPSDVTVERTYETLPVVAVTAQNAGSVDELRSLSTVESVRENEVYDVNLAETTAVINANNAWDAGFSGSGLAVAILDTGVDTTHPFLGGRVVHEACFSSAADVNATSLCPDGSTQQFGAGAASPTRCARVSGCSHGTHVAGIAAGNGSSFDGVASNADIIAIQIFSRFPSGLGAYTSDYLAALEYIHTTLANQHNVVSVNMSIGNGANNQTDCDSQLPNVANAISNLRDEHGIATVISAGNNGFSNGVGAPGCVSSAITVGSTTDSDSISGFSNRGDLVELMAPGSLVNSSVIGGGFQNFNGTSMAAPHVAGAWAVVRSMPQFANASVDDVLAHLESMAVTISSGGKDYPRLNFAPVSSDTNCPQDNICFYDGADFTGEMVAVPAQSPYLGAWWFFAEGYDNFYADFQDQTSSVRNNSDHKLTVGGWEQSQYEVVSANSEWVADSVWNDTIDFFLIDSDASSRPTCSADKVCLYDGDEMLELEPGQGWVYLDDLGWDNRVDGLVNNSSEKVSLYDYDGQGYHSNPSTLIPGIELSTLGDYNDATDAVLLR